MLRRAVVFLARAAWPNHAAPAPATRLGPHPRRGFMVQGSGTRERPACDKSLDQQDKWSNPSKKTKTNAPGTKYKPRMEADTSEEEIKQARKEQHTTAAPDTGGAKTGTGTGAEGSETGGSKKSKKKAESTAAVGKGAGVGAEKKSGKFPISGHPAKGGYARWEQDRNVDYRPDA